MKWRNQGQSVTESAQRNPRKKESVNLVEWNTPECQHAIAGIYGQVVGVDPISVFATFLFGMQGTQHVCFCLEKYVVWGILTRGTHHRKKF